MSLVVELSHFVSFSWFLPGPNKVSEKNIQSSNTISVQESTHQTNGSSSSRSLFHPNHSRWTPAHLGEEYQHPHRFTFQIIRFHYMWFDILLCDWTHICIPKCGFYSCMVCWWPLEMKRDCFPTSSVAFPFSIMAPDKGTLFYPMFVFIKLQQIYSFLIKLLYPFIVVEHLHYKTDVGGQRLSLKCRDRWYNKWIKNYRKNSRLSDKSSLK